MDTFKNLAPYVATAYSSGSIYIHGEYKMSELYDMIRLAQNWLKEYNDNKNKKVFIKEDFIKEVLQNLPECSISLRCTVYEYIRCIFRFIDGNNKEYVIDLPKFIKGYDILRQLFIDKKCFFDGIKTVEDWEDPCQWDALVVDALVQCSIFGEIIYG